jgi:hypothetical protein
MVTSGNGPNLWPARSVCPYMVEWQKMDVNELPVVQIPKWKIVSVVQIPTWKIVFLVSGNGHWLVDKLSV